MQLVVVKGGRSIPTRPPHNILSEQNTVSMASLSSDTEEDNRVSTSLAKEDEQHPCSHQQTMFAFLGKKQKCFWMKYLLCMPKIREIKAFNSASILKRYKVMSDVLLVMCHGSMPAVVLYSPIFCSILYLCNTKGRGFFHVFFVCVGWTVLTEKQLSLRFLFLGLYFEKKKFCILYFYFGT